MCVLCPCLECPSHVLDLNQTDALNAIINCTVINGNLVISGLSNTQCGPNGLSLPHLFEIIGSLSIEYSSCNGDLSHFLPNLMAIHGYFPLPNISSPGFKIPALHRDLIIHHTALSGIGLRCLRVIGKNGVFLVDNPQMCYTDSISWPLLSPSHSYSWKNVVNSTSERRQGEEWSQLGTPLLYADGLFDLCANACPLECEKITVNNLPRSLCWSGDHCQHGKFELKGLLDFLLNGS